MLFYRYQGTTEIETNSCYVDLELLYEDLDEYKHSFDSKEELHAELFHKYYRSLSLRNIPAADLFQKVISAHSIEDVQQLIDTYPVNGIFGMNKDEVDDYISFEDLLTEPPWASENDSYLVLYEGNQISYEGEESGIIFEPIRILSCWKTKR